jgi:L-ascorbate metabolism protein UlaG (beta-lactamase superfamily)
MAVALPTGSGVAMSTCSITAWGHSGVRLERDGNVLVFDPGSFTDPAILDGAGAVLVTHEHADHVQPDQLAAAATADSSLQVWAPEPVAGQLTGAGAPAAQVHVATVGGSFTAAGFAVQVLGGRHAEIHPTLPTAVNVAYLVEHLALHPGDSFTPPPDGVTVHTLFLPVTAPWLKIAEAADYLQRVAPQVAVPVHDAILNDAGTALVDRVLTSLAGAVPYRRLARGEALEAGAAG